MLKDVSDWEHIGYGGKSTLEKEELKSPNQLKYLIKYPRKVKVGVSWEDITEFVAAQIGTIFGLEMMKVEIVIRNGRRGCLLRNFVDEFGAKMYEEGGVLLTSLVEGYNELQESRLKNIDLIDAGFQMISKLEYWATIKEQFLNMLVFDILIGNQDRHPFNWLILYFDTEVKFSPIYDNGASLGFRFEDEKLMEMVSDVAKLNKYVRNTKVKAGLFERKYVKARDLLAYIQIHYSNELANSVKRLKNFDLDRYKQFIQSLELLSEVQKNWLKLIVPYRREKILEWIQKEGECYE
ncbi:hypothetical protein DCC39_12595 [Pueribacillus theae]|uniref:HipA-like C-terminal domain-containing protein n=1 Tax=Pueribacillus theae TaxID=2171751 RepID=A0A2U1JXZ9_9BACI|nr:HipA domain-containing protein [Pueribacillus theae]PWA09678.1 hypothetical protein DCC39_12595 [Pueribacillus theae]